jgi:AcrR family transcriptional regulator
VLIDDAKPRRGRPIRGDGPDLRIRFIDAAYAKVIESGAEAVSMRGLAEGLGVSASAYLHHFDGPREILGEVALRGFEELRNTLGDTSGSGDRDAVVSTGMAYITFGVTNGRLYRTMFSRVFARGLAEAERAASQTDQLFKSGSPSSMTMIARESERSSRRDAFFGRLKGVKDEAWSILLARFETLGLEENRAESAGLAYAALLHGLVGEFIDEGLFPPERGSIYDLSPERHKLAWDSIDLFLDGALSKQPSKSSPAD